MQTTYTDSELSELVSSCNKLVYSGCLRSFTETLSFDPPQVVLEAVKPDGQIVRTVFLRSSGVWRLASHQPHDSWVN